MHYIDQKFLISRGWKEYGYGEWHRDLDKSITFSTKKALRLDRIFSEILDEVASGTAPSDRSVKSDEKCG